MPRSGVLRCLAAAVLFGLSTPAASVLAQDVPTLTLAGLLYLGAASAVVPSVLGAPPSARAARAEWRPLLVAVVVGGGAGPVLLVAGLARTDAATAAILLNLELVVTVALAGTLFREQLGARVVAGAALVTVAGVLLSWTPVAGVDGGALLVVAACVCWGVDNVVTAGMEQLSPASVVLAKGAMAGGVNVALGATLVGQLDASPGEIAAALLIGAVGYGVSITLWVTGARELGAARAQLIFASAPFVGALGAWMVLDEPTGAVGVVAFVLAALGVAVSLDSAHRHDHVHEEVVHDHRHAHDDPHHGHASDDAVHAHLHHHRQERHAHPHVPDLHHRHHHDQDDASPR